MKTYRCSACGGSERASWTDYYVRIAMDLPILCAICDPRQRCPWHNDVTRRAQDEAGIAEVDD